jgi:hypothetical protein
MPDIPRVKHWLSLSTMGTHQVFPFGPPDARLTVGLFLFVCRRGKQMKILGTALLAAALAGCGGGSGGMTDRLAGQVSEGIAVGEPAPTALAMGEFQAMAREGICIDIRNRLFIIDGTQVLWDHAGNCADASYEQVLYGARPATVLCSHGDSIAGPRTTCPDEKSRTLFETIVKNLDKADLGLGGAHKVERVDFLPKAGTEMPFRTVSQTTQSKVEEARTVVIRDAAAWQLLWQYHAPDAPLPPVDFSTTMIVGVFMGSTNPCYSTLIANLTRSAGKITVTKIDRHPPPDVMCAAVVTYPAHLVAVERSELPVEFATQVVQRN